MYQVDTIYIVVKYTNSYNHFQIESVWTTPELAKSAIQYHAMEFMQQGNEFNTENYSVIERKLNTTKKL